MTTDPLEKLQVHVRYARFLSNPVSAEAPVQISGTVYSCRIGRHSVLNGAYIGEKTTIGRYCQAALGSQIGIGGHPTDWLSTHFFQYRDHFEPYPSDHPESLYGKFEETQPTSIGSDSWVGSNAFIKSGVTVGPGAIIAAGAVVLDDVPPYAIVGGVPARTIRLRFPEPTIARLLRVRWWEFPHEAVSRLPFNDVERSLDILEQRIARQEIAREPDKHIRIA
jgi:acetyltransferase-like isoleucine patch superfamily enzyme